MPNLITHALFAEELLKKLENKELERNPHLFKVGAQGPDFLFFHNLSPYTLAKSSPLHTIGSKLHQSQINPFYQSMLESIRAEKNPEKKKDMIVYAAGHLSHWALDSSTHPYIFYRTGNCQGKSSWNHHQMESMLDAILLKIKTGQSIQKENFAEEIARTSQKEKAVIASLYAPALDALFPGQAKASMIAQSLIDWHFMQKLLYDPREHKKKLARAIETPIGLKGLFSGLLIPVTIKDNADILNLLHAPWKHPVHEAISTASFLDLYDSGLDKAKQAITLFLQAVEDPEAEKDFLAFIDDGTYTMGTSSQADPHCFHATSFI